MGATAGRDVGEELPANENGLLDTAAYLRGLLSSEAAFEAAFQPTWRVAALSENVGDRAVFSETVARICSHFDSRADVSDLLSDDLAHPLSRSEAWSMLGAALKSVVQNLEA